MVMAVKARVYRLSVGLLLRLGRLFGSCALGSEISDHYGAFHVSVTTDKCTRALEVRY